MSNILNETAALESRIGNDILFCTLTAIVITSIIAKSNLDRLIYCLVIIGVSIVAYKNWEILSYGTAVIVFVADISLILIAAIKRNYPSKLGDTAKDIIGWCLASPIMLLLILGEFMGFLNIFRLNEGFVVLIVQILIGVICGLSNFVYTQWICRKKIHSPELQSRILYYFKFILIGIAVIGVFVGFLIYS